MGTHRLDRIRRAAVSGLCLTFLALFAFGAAEAGAAPVEARQADSFAESVGVNVHLTYSDTPYDDFAELNRSLQELGVRYIRDGVGLGRPDVYAHYRALAAEGIKLDMIVGDPLQRYGLGSLSQQLDMIEKEFPEAIATLEGPNEFDNQGAPNWVTELRAYQRNLWESVQRRPRLSSKPILGPSLVRESSRAELGDISAWTDQGNMHPYPGGQIPDANTHAESEFRLAAQNTVSQPVEATETGYQNAVNDTTAGNRPVSEQASGIYTPRLFLDNFRRGIVRTYDYELIDNEADPSLAVENDHFGLVKNDWTPKPAYTALQRLLRITEDPGPGFVPQPLDFTLRNAPATSRQVLLQRRDGSYDLILWNAVSVWNTQSLTAINPPSPNVNVVFEQPVENVEVFRPNESAAAVSSSTGQTMPLPLSPSVTLLHVVPAGGQLPPSTGGEPTEPTVPVVPTKESKQESKSPTGSSGAGTPTETGSAGRDEKSSGTSESHPPESVYKTAPGAKRSVHAKMRAIARRVRSGCASGCPLRRDELSKARRLLRSGLGKSAARSRSDRRVADWLERREAALARTEGGLEGEQLLRYLTIRLVLKTAHHGRHG
jgi:hypothetical protein